MNSQEDLRDWPHVSLPDARDAADALGWRDELERGAAKDVSQCGADFRAAFIFRLINGIGGAMRKGTPLDSFPKKAIEVYRMAGKEPEQKPEEEGDGE